MNRKRAIALSMTVWVPGMIVLPAAVGQAEVATTTGLVQVSGPTPLPPDGDPAWCGTDADHQNWEQDNSLVTDPVTGALITAWQQDWADAIVVAYSSGPGTNWKSVVPKTTKCTWLLNGVVEKDVPDNIKPYSTHASAFDPWLAIGPAPGPANKRTAYLTSVLTEPDTTGNDVAINRSLDGGRSWTDPVLLDRVAGGFDGDYLDTSWITADQTQARAGRAYALWVRGDAASTRRDQRFSRTLNFGGTWSKPESIPSTPGRLTASGQLHILADGTLLNVAAEVPPQPTAGPSRQLVGPTTLVARRYEDGKGWSAPSTIALADSAAFVFSTMAPDGKTVHAVWQDFDGTQYILWHSRFIDGGTGWSRPDIVAQSDHGRLGFGGIAATGDGTVGVSFYDHQNDPDGSNSNPLLTKPLTTDYRFRHSHDGGSSWTDIPIAGPFDQADAPNRDGSFTGPGYIGDYQGIAPTTDGFAASFVLARPLDGANFTLSNPITDIFYTRIRS